MQPTIINVIFRAGRGECQTMSKEATTGERYGELPIARRQGYQFDGWYTSDDKLGQRVSAGDLVTSDEDIVLYARYSKKKGAAAKKKKSSYRLQKNVLFALLGVVALLIVAFFVVNYIVSIIPFTDYDGAEYKAKKVDGVYSIFDADGYELETNEDGYYLTQIGTQLKLDPVTGKITVFAVVATEGIEVAGAAQRILMFAQIKQANVVSLEVHNHNGDFKIYTKDITAEKKEIVIEGYEDGKYLVSYDPELYAYLCVAAGYPLTINKLPTDRVAELGLAEYGLVSETRTDEEGNEYEYTPIEYTITGALKNADGSWKKDADGKVVTVSHTVIIGDPVVGNGGYYCMLKGDNKVYMMNNDNYEKALFQPIENLITKRITYPATMTTCFNVENFLLGTCIDGSHLNIDVDVAFDYIDLTMRSSTMYSAEPYQTGSGYRYQFGGYRLHSDVLSTILQAMYEPSISKICKLGVHKDEGVLADYGLDKPYKILSYDLQLDTNGDVKFDSFVTNTLWISEKTENGTYYVYSELCDVVAEVKQISMYFVEFDTLDWINPAVIWHNLAYLKTMDIISPSYSSHLEFDNSRSDQSENVNSLDIQFTINGVTPDYVVYKTAYATGKVTEENPVYNLRQFYKTLLSLTIGGDARVGDHFTLSEEEMAALRALDDSKCQLIISIDSEDYAKITNPTYFPQNNKKQMVFRFYRYSEGRSYMTINGEGEFFVDASFVEKMLADAKRLEDGILIDSTAKN
ncbi:MAG: DUF4340 domain-containing protein [Ruminococcaceae bacterium]|nr:DUF4340 domain-containing protein [Oscillospiraceae bacterium]